MFLLTVSFWNEVPPQNTWLIKFSIGRHILRAIGIFMREMENGVQEKTKKENCCDYKTEHQKRMQRWWHE